MALTQDQQKYYDELEEMMACPGWKSLIEEAKSEIYQLQADALDAEDWASVCRIRGNAERLAYFINLEEIAAMQKASLAEDD